MKVRYYVRSDWQRKLGGDVVQAGEYVAGLARMGWDAGFLGNNEKLQPGDILHVFNIDRPWDVLNAARQARACGAYVVLSPIFHPRGSVERYQRQRSFGWERMLAAVGFSCDALERFKSAARAVLSCNVTALHCSCIFGRQSAATVLWNTSDAIQFLSEAEADALSRNGFNARSKISAVVRNGVRKAQALGEERMPEVLRSFIVRNPRFAIVGGRVEPRKNQIAIAETAVEQGIPVVFAGAINRRHAKYGREFAQTIEGSKFLCHVGALSRTAFSESLKLAHMHISASLFEVSSLVDLEARAAGAWVVSSSESYGREYLDEGAVFCDPWSPQSIASAMQAVWVRGYKPSALNVPSWESCVADVAELYRRLINQ